MRISSTALIIAASSILILDVSLNVLAQSTPAARTLTSVPPPKVSNRQLLPLDEPGRQGVRLSASAGDGVAWWPDVQFANGTIEIDLRGKDVPQQSFLGIAFHGVDDKTFDGVYFRPFNFKAAAPAARSHAVQYVSHPAYTWDKLRAERPDQFEHEVAPAPDPNGWFHARVVVAYPSVKVFVNDEATPVLDVKQLSDRKTGWVGVWVGNTSDGAFANLVLKPSAR